VQRIAKNRWRYAALGDSSVVVLNSRGQIRDGFGEAFQLLRAGRITRDGAAEDAPLQSFVGMAKNTLEGYVDYGTEGYGAAFGEIQLNEGERIAIVSDAYVQKTPPSTLEADATKTATQWAAEAPRYGDDTTMALVA
jgi:hypothetical protein